MKSSNTNRILFQKPDLPHLTRHHTVVDLHVHSKYSDGINTVDEIVQEARKLNIGIAITDHNEIKGAVKIHQYRDILSIPGIEVTSKEGTHILIYFYDTGSLQEFYQDAVAPNRGPDVMSSTKLKLEEIITAARAYKSLIIAPHPYCAAYTGLYNHRFPEERFNGILGSIDGVEAINSSNFSKWNLKGTVLGFNLNKAMTGGSDGHSLSQIGGSVTVTEGIKNCKSFLDAVRKKKNTVVGKEIDFLRKVRAGRFRLKSTIRNYPELVEKNIRYSYAVLNSKSQQIRSDVMRKIEAGRIKK